MPFFRDTQHLYKVLDTFFSSVARDREIAPALLAGKFILRFRYSTPDGQVTVDLRGEDAK